MDECVCVIKQTRVVW